MLCLKSQKIVCVRARMIGKLVCVTLFFCMLIENMRVYNMGVCTQLMCLDVPVQCLHSLH